MTDNRENILLRLMALLETIGPPVERNRTTEIPETELPIIVMSDGQESIAPPENTPAALAFDRWQMTPEIEYYLNPTAGTTVGEAQQSVLDAISGDRELLALLAGRGIVDADFDPYYANGRTTIAGFRLTISLIYDKK